MALSQEKCHSEGVWCCDWKTPFIVTGSLDETVKCWQIADNKFHKKMEFSGHHLGVVSVCSHAATNVLATSAMDSHIRLFDLEAEKQKATIDAGPVGTWTVDFHHGGKLLASGTQSGKINLWDAEQGALAGSIDTKGNFAMSVAFSPDGKLVAAGGHDGTVSILDVDQRKVITQLEGHSLPVRSLAFTPSGLLLSGSDDMTINIHDIEHGFQLKNQLTGHTSWVLSVAVSPANHQIFATGGSDKKLKVWDVNSTQCLNTNESHTDQVWQVAFNSDGTQMASVGDDARLQVMEMSSINTTASS